MDIFKGHSFPEKQKTGFLVFNCCDYKWRFWSLRLTETLCYVLSILKNMSVIIKKHENPPQSLSFLFRFNGSSNH